MNSTINLLNGWYVIYTKPRHEIKVFTELIFKKYNSYLPLVKHTSIWNDRQKVIDKPLFPSYVFVFLHNMLDYHKALQINGVVSFIRFNNQPAKVKESEIETIKKMIENCSNIELAQHDIKVGEKHTIQSGVLAGFECEVVSINGKSKILVRIDSLSQNIIAELKVSSLIKSIL
jgi:transcription antitermination factor NusG